MAIFSYKVGDAARVLTTKLKKKGAFFFAPSGTMHGHHEHGVHTVNSAARRAPNSDASQGDCSRLCLRRTP